MGLLDRLFGRREPERPPREQTRAQAAPPTEDERAVERYRYLLRTAPPEQIEQAHAEAFAKLTPEQRREVLAELSVEDPSTPASDDPRSLARSATRAEMRQPGTLERTFGGRGRGTGGGMGGGFGTGGGLGMGSMIGGTLLASVAGAFIGTAVADALLPDDLGNDQWGDDQAGEDQQAGDEQAADQGYDDQGYQDAGYDDGGGDLSGGDFGGGDFGGDVDI